VSSEEKASLNNNRFSFYHLGKKGDVIILLHGWGASKEKLLPLGKALLKKGWQVFIPDLPGFGTSSMPKTAWGIEEYARFILGIIDKFYKNHKVYILGHSFGGRIGIRIAASTERVAGIILCGTAGISRKSFFKRIFFFTLAKIGKLIFPFSGFRLLVYKLAREHDYERAKGIMREVFKKVVAEDLKPLLPHIKIPTLIIWGKLDKMTPVRDAYFIHQKIKNASLTIFENEGHTLLYDKQEEVAEVITKWKKQQT